MKELHRLAQLGDDFEAAVSQMNSSAMMHFYLGLVYQQTSRNDEALAEFKNALRWDSKNFPANLLLGRMYIKQQKADEAIRSLGGAHIVLNLAPAPQAVEQGFKALRRGGTLVLVGLPQGNFSLPVLGSVAKGIRILTSAVGTRQDLREVLALAAAGKIKTVAETCRLEEINSVFERMRQGKISGRAVIEFT